MRLFHSTNTATKLLLPMVGRNRHGAEAANAVGQPAIWLSSKPMWHFENGKPYRFRYTVEVAQDDPDLHEDKSVGEMGARTLRILSGGTDVEPNRYYYLMRPAEVMAVEEWNDSLRDYAPDADVRGPVNVTLIGRGAEADILQDEAGRALKLFRDLRTGAISACREEESLRHCQKGGFPVPTPLHRFTSKGRAGLAMSLVRGVELGADLFNLVGAGSAVGTTLGQFHASLHRLAACATPAIPSYMNVFQAAASEHGLGALLAELPGGQLLCHGDFHADNVLLVNGSPVVLDWSRAFIGPPEADVATTLVRLRAVQAPAQASQQERSTFRANLLEIEETYLKEYERNLRLDHAVVQNWVRVAAAEANMTGGGTTADLWPLISGLGSFRWP